MKRHTVPLAPQRGVALLEALISILIMSFGILAIIGLQANAVRLSTDAKYRSDAVLAANRLIGEMLAGDRTTATLQAAYQTGGASFLAWQATIPLPGVAANPPTVTFGGNGLITIVVSWHVPGEKDSAGTDIVHRHQAVTQILSCTGVC